MKIKSTLKALAKALSPIPERGFRAAYIPISPIPNRALRSFIAAALILHFTLYTLHSPAGEPCHWNRVPNNPAPFQFDTYHGETIDFRCTFVGFFSLPFAGSGDSSPRLYYQTNGMAAAWWDIPATVSTTVVTNCQPPITNYSLSAAFPPSADPGAERLNVFFGAPSNAYAAAQVRFRNSPGATPNVLPPPVTIDWLSQLTSATNALSIDLLAELTSATNALSIDLLAELTSATSSVTTALKADITSATNSLSKSLAPTITNTVTKAYVEDLGIESGISAATATNIAFAVSADATNTLLKSLAPTITNIVDDMISPLQLARWYPDGSVTNESQFTQGLNYTFDDSTHTAMVKPFCVTAHPGVDDNSHLVSSVVIPPYVVTNGVRYSVVGILGGVLYDVQSNLKSITSPITITSVGDGAFTSCTSLASVSIPAATSIGYAAFASCTSLASISLPSATSIGGATFANCTSLVSVSLPSAISIGDSAFAECTSLASVSIPSATSISSAVFDSCTSLVSVSMPAATSIGDGAFTACTSLVSVSIPSATSISGATFANCTSLAVCDFGGEDRERIPPLGINAFYSVPTSCIIVVPDGNYDAWISASGWSDLVAQGYRFLRHSEWEYARRYEIPATLSQLTNDVGYVTASITNGLASTNYVNTAITNSEHIVTTNILATLRLDRLYRVACTSDNGNVVFVGRIMSSTNNPSSLSLFGTIQNTEGNIWADWIEYEYKYFYSCLIGIVNGIPIDAYIKFQDAYSFLWTGDAPGIMDYLLGVESFEVFNP